MRFRQISFLCLKLAGIVLFVLIIAEVILRITNPLNFSELFVKSPSNEKLLILNSRFSQRYSTTTKFLSVPAIKKKKEQNTLRIFFLGSPVPDKMPYNPNITYPHILNNMLQRSFPEKNIEVVSIPLNESNSFIHHDICKQLPKYNPDYVLINPGGNEFASHSNNSLFTFSLLSNRISNSLAHFQLFFAINKFITKHSSHPYNYDSNATMERFEKNVTEMVAFLIENNIKPILINNSQNLMDIPPQKSVFSSPDSVRLQKLFVKGEIAFFSNDCESAYSCFSQIYHKDKAHAATAYYLGKLALKQKVALKAKHLLQKAAEADKSLHRAIPHTNTIISRIAAVQGCPFIDVSDLFSKHSPEGIPGDNLLFGYSQPNLPGNILIAIECYKILTSDKKINLTSTLNTLSISNFDSLYNSICAEMSINDRKILTFYYNSPHTTSYEKRLVRLFSENKTSWEDCMNSLYDYYIANKNYSMAFKIIDSLALENPYNIAIHEKASKTASMIGDSQLVVFYGKKVFESAPRIDIAQLLFINYLKLDKPENALPYISYIQTKTNQNEFKSINSNTQQIIKLKKLLRNNPSNSELRRDIARHYSSLGNEEIAMLYSGSLNN